MPEIKVAASKTTERNRIHDTDANGNRMVTRVQTLLDPVSYGFSKDFHRPKVGNASVT